MTVASALAPVSCDRCRTEIAPGLRVCPGCHRLVFSRELQELAAEAEAAANARDHSGELRAWRMSLDFLPADSRQFAVIAAKVDALSRSVELKGRAAGDAPASGPWKWLAVLGPVGLLIWKFKFVLALLLTKGKLLFLGLTKASTFFSMLLSMGVYWTAWGLPFAIGFVVSIYIHEMWHVAALRRYGIAASAPMFIPGLGALIRMRQAPVNPREDAIVGLAGPLWGLGAAVIAYVIAMFTDSGLWAAIAKTGAWINLFNLLPVWHLDGSRGFAALARRDRWTMVLAFAVAWAITADGLMVLLLLVAAVRAATGEAPAERDRATLVRFAAITIALALVFSAAGAHNALPGAISSSLRREHHREQRALGWTSSHGICGTPRACSERTRVYRYRHALAGRRDACGLRPGGAPNENRAARCHSSGIGSTPA
jgi:Zn-dependent protease